MNLGVVIGPAAAGLALGWGVTFRELFLAAAAGCLAMVVMMSVWVRESRPASALLPAAHVDREGRSGYGIVLADRRFLLFCAVAVLPVFCIGNFGSIYSVYITEYLGVGAGTWGMLLSLNALIVATVQYPLVRTLKMKNRMVLLAVSSGLLGLGIGGSAFAVSLLSLVVLVAVMSLGEVLLSPVASAEVSDFAPEAVRGRYMGVWTVVWSGGAALGPAFGGWAMDALGGREAFAIFLFVGLLGAALFAMLAPAWRRHHRVLVAQES
jgi:MFS family permease